MELIDLHWSQWSFGFMLHFIFMLNEGKDCRVSCKHKMPHLNFRDTLYFTTCTASPHQTVNFPNMTEEMQTSNTSVCNPEEKSQFNNFSSRNTYFFHCKSYKPVFFPKSWSSRWDCVRDLQCSTWRHSLYLTVEGCRRLVSICVCRICELLCGRCVYL